MDTNFQKIKADPNDSIATTGTQMQNTFNGNFDKIKQNFTEQQESITNQQTTVNGLVTEVSDLSGEVDALGNEVATQETEIEALQGAIVKQQFLVNGDGAFQYDKDVEFIEVYKPNSASIVRFVFAATEYDATSLPGKTLTAGQYMNIYATAAAGFAYPVAIVRYKVK